MENTAYKGCVYRATLIVGNKRKRRCYIGKSIIGLGARRSQHYAQAKRGITTHFAQALLAYDKSAFVWEKLFCSDDDELLNAIEIEQIAAHRSEGWHLFNHSDGGGGVTGWKWSEELRATMMQKHESRKQAGLTKMSAAHKAKISVARMGKPAPFLSEEARERISVAKKAYWAKVLSGPDAEAIKARNAANALKGNAAQNSKPPEQRKLSAETRAKISASRRARIIMDKERARLEKP